MAKAKSIKAEFTCERIRQIGALARRPNGGDFSTKEARAIMLLYSNDIRLAMEQAAIELIKGKLE